MNKKILGLLCLTLLAAILVMPMSVNAAGCGDITGSGAGALDDIMGRLIAAATVLGAAISVIGFIVAGIIYLTAAGSPEKLGIAKKALIAAVIGTAILALAQGSQIMTGIFCDILGTTKTTGTGTTGSQSLPVGSSCTPGEDQCIGYCSIFTNTCQ